MNGLEEIYQFVSRSIQGIGHGSITLIVQDGKIVQMDKLEKVRFTSNWNISHGKTHNSQSLRFNNLEDKVRSSLNSLRYGQITVLIQNGAIVQIDRTEKHRYPHLEGVNGEGI